MYQQSGAAGQHGPSAEPTDQQQPPPPKDEGKKVEDAQYEVVDDKDKKPK
jgi:hypothetical protein